MSHAKQRLAQARSKIETLNAQHEAVQAERQAIASNAQSLLQKESSPSGERIGFLARILRSGSKLSDGQIEKMRAEVANTAAIAAHNAEIEAAKQKAMADLDEKHLSIITQRRALGAELAEATFEAARDEITDELIPEFLQACELFKAAYAKLVAAGAAHTELAASLREQHGIAAQGLGVPWPNRTIDIPLPGFSIGIGGGSNLIRLDFSTEIDQVKREALQRWR